MRRLLVILMLVFTVWAVLPGAAQAHGEGHPMPPASACPECVTQLDRDTAAEAMAHDCHHVAGCAIHALPAAVALVGPVPLSPQAVLPEALPDLRSAPVSRTLRPPRS